MELMSELMPLATVVACGIFAVILIILGFHLRRTSRGAHKRRTEEMQNVSTSVWSKR